LPAMLYMGTAMQLFAIPVAFTLVVILSAVWASLSIAAVALGAFVLLLVVLATSLLLSFVWGLEEEEGIHEAQRPPRAHVSEIRYVQEDSAQNAARAMTCELPTVTAIPEDEHPPTRWN